MNQNNYQTIQLALAGASRWLFPLFIIWLLGAVGRQIFTLFIWPTIDYPRDRVFRVALVAETELSARRLSGL